MEVGELSMYSRLSSPLPLSSDFDDSLKISYEYFDSQINNRARRPALFDKEIYIEANEKIDDRPVGFWHIVSMEETHKFTVLPCNNDETMEHCDENCLSKRHQIRIKYQTETRNICLLRASRLPWILDIIKFANRDDPSVIVWKKPDGKLYLRYNHFGNDFVLIFSENKHYYRLISAFPVFYTKERKEFNRDSQEYKWSYFSSK